MFGILMLVLFILLVYGLIKIGIETIYMLAFLGFLFAIKDVFIGIFAGLLPIIKIVAFVFIALLVLALIIEAIDRIKGKNPEAMVTEVIEVKEAEETVDVDSFGRFE
jgi:hypothetical protein